MARVLRNTVERGARAITVEEVLLQIALAFMVFLGYLLSRQGHYQADLDERLSDIELGMETHGSGDHFQQAAMARNSEQRYMLLNEWLRERPAVRLFYWVGEFRRSAPRGGLATLEGDAMLTHAGFKELINESARLYGTRQTRHEADYRRAAEVEAQVDLCLNRAGLVRATETSVTPIQAGTRHTGPEELTGQLESGKASVANVQFLREQIRNDYELARPLVKAIQAEAYYQLGEARLGGSKERDVAKLKERHLDLARKELRLLPELEQEITTGGGTR